jgi:hypothetical protein
MQMITNHLKTRVHTPSKTLNVSTEPYKDQRYNTASAKDYQWTQSWACSIHLPSSQPVLHLILSFHLLVSFKWLHSEEFLHQNSVWISVSSIHPTCPFHLNVLDFAILATLGDLVPHYVMYYLSYFPGHFIFEHLCRLNAQKLYGWSSSELEQVTFLVLCILKTLSYT